MRVGIITYHFAENYGSALQAYALASYFNSFDDVDAEILNYVSKRQELNNSLYGHRNGISNIAVSLAYLPFHYWRNKKHRRFKMFAERKLPLSKRMSTIPELSESINTTYTSSDCIVSGSDQVWNPKINDFDRAFLFPFKTNAKKLGYAISLGPALKGDVLDLRKDINDFSSVACREYGAAATLKSIGLDVDQVVCDPVFLIDIEHWRDLSKLSAVDYSSKNPYLVCYFLNKQAMKTYYNWAHSLASDMGLEPIIINAAYSAHTFQKGVILDAGPLEFLNLLMNASFVCTDSFHGTALSALFEKQFLSFDREAGSVDTRKADLLNEIGLLSRLKRIGEYSGGLVEPLTQSDFEKAAILRNQYILRSSEYIVKRYLDL